MTKTTNPSYAATETMYARLIEALRDRGMTADRMDLGEAGAAVRIPLTSGYALVTHGLTDGESWELGTYDADDELADWLILDNYDQALGAALAIARN